MITCALFKINEIELDTKIDDYKCVFGKNPTLECNHTTFNLWTNYLVEKKSDLMIKIECMGLTSIYYDGNLVIIDDDMEDGIIQIK